MIHYYGTLLGQSSVNQQKHNKGSHAQALERFVRICERHLTWHTHENAYKTHTHGYKTTVFDEPVFFSISYNGDAHPLVCLATLGVLPDAEI